VAQAKLIAAEIPGLDDPARLQLAGEITHAMVTDLQRIVDSGLGRTRLRRAVTDMVFGYYGRFEKRIALEHARADFQAAFLRVVRLYRRGGGGKHGMTRAHAEAEMDKLIARYHKAAYKLGLAEHGGKMKRGAALPDHVQADIDFNKERARLMLDEVDRRLGEGMLVDAYSDWRATLYSGAVGGEYWWGWVETLPDDAVIYWHLDPGAEGRHCFPAGTMIATADGDMPIEAVRIGTVVRTLYGDRRVTRLYEREANEPLVSVSAAGREVQCTANHPFLTQRGWIAAEDLRRGDNAVLFEDGAEPAFAEITFPDVDHGVPAGPKVSILSRIAALLGQLALRRCSEARVPMPVVAVRLDDEIANANIHHELRFDKRRRLELNVEGGQHFTQTAFKAAWLLAVKAGMALRDCQLNALHLFRMVFAPLTHLGLGPFGAHRIAGYHILSGRGMNEAAVDGIIQSDTQFTSLAGNGGGAYAQCGSDSLTPLLGIVGAEVSNALGGPSNIGARATRARWSGCLSAFLAAGEARLVYADLQLQAAPQAIARRIDAAMFPRQMVVAAGGPAEIMLADIAGWQIPLEGGTAFVADKCGRDFRVLHHGSVPSVLYNCQPTTVKVYNLEVEDAHHYIANGFVVHNCDDCPRIAENGPYTKTTLPTVPGAGETACLRACRCWCSLSVTS
jgi:hypothetical protein